MNVDSMNNSITTVSHPSAKQHPYDNYQQGRNTTQNNTSSEDDIKVANKEKKSRNTPTPLYIYFFHFFLIIIMSTIFH